MNELIEKINKQNVLKYGPIQECCGLFKNYCRCSLPLNK